MFNNQPLVCTTCGYVGNPQRITKGSTLIELILWLCFLIPGLIYSLWRLSSKYDACPKCKGVSMIPVDSPIGQKTINDHKNALGTDLVETYKIESQKENSINIKLSAIVIGFIIIMVSISAYIGKENERAMTPSTPATGAIQPAKEVKMVFDIPALLGKNIEGVKKVLGTPSIDTEPTKQQLSAGIIEWEKTYDKDGENLLVTYDAKTRIVKDFFLSGMEKNNLLIIGGVKENAQNYKVEFVKAIKDPSKITGMLVSKK